MTADDLKKKLGALEKQRAQVVQALAQLDGAIGFCKALVAEAGDAPVPVNRVAERNGVPHPDPITD